MSGRTTRRLESLMALLAFLAAMPYENGPIAVIIPPTWKPYVAAASLAAKLILDEVKARQTAHRS